MSFIVKYEGDFIIIQKYRFDKNINSCKNWHCATARPSIVKLKKKLLIWELPKHLLWLIPKDIYCTVSNFKEWKQHVSYKWIKNAGAQIAMDFS